jgi:hypothetical protein
MKVTSASVTDIGRSLRLAREQAGRSVQAAADAAHLTPAEVEALESGTEGRLRDRVETLRSLRTYADSLNLPGNDYVLAFLDLWPAADQLPASLRDSGQVPVVSVSSAPAGGHSPAAGEDWPVDRTGVADFSVTGVVSPLGTLPVGDAGAMVATENSPLSDTGEIPAVRQSAPRALKVLTGLVALLVLLGLFTLTERSHFTAWHNDLQADGSRWTHDLKVAAGLAPKKTVRKDPPQPGTLPKVVMVTNGGGASVTFDVHASQFSVKMVAYKGPSWMLVTNSSQQAPIYEQVMPAGVNQVFVVTHSMTVETGSSYARAYLYEGYEFIGAYFPSKAPFTLTFNAVG